MKTIELTQGFVAIVDECDYQRLVAYRWWAQVEPRGYVYAVTRTQETGRKLVKMHRLILGLNSDGPFVDHHDGDGLNNARGNLRLASRQGNRVNSRKRSGYASSYKGVVASHRKWKAKIRVGATMLYLGTFENEVDAAAAYNAAAIAQFGEFARLNKLEA